MPVLPLAALLPAGLSCSPRRNSYSAESTKYYEVPSAVTGNAMVTRLGLTFIVEPGVYLPDLGGTRIEENVVVTPDGMALLTTYLRELRTL